MSDPNIEILRKETLIKLIENSVGSRMFRSLFVRYRDGGEIKDILNNGEISCAYFVSSLLYITDMINKPRATVMSVERFLKESGQWEEVDLKHAEAGDVVVWEKQVFPDGKEHAHIGFIISKDEAVSTDNKQKRVARHPVTLDNRKITAVYRSVDKNRRMV